MTPATDVFAFRDELLAEYLRFSRSFTRIRADDISRAVDKAYEAGRFWPAPLIQLNPSFEPGGWIDALVSDGTLDAECANIFRLKNKADTSGQPIRLRRHQTAEFHRRRAEKDGQGTLSEVPGKLRPSGGSSREVSAALRQTRGRAASPPCAAVAHA